MGVVVECGVGVVVECGVGVVVECGVGVVHVAVEDYSIYYIKASNASTIT